MSVVIWPITTAGSTDKSSDLLRYASRDFYGTQALAATPTDFRGADEIFAWTRRQEAAALVEHSSPGIHNTVKIPRQVITLTWTSPAAYNVVHESYGQDTATATRLRGTAAATASRVSAGKVDIVLGDALPAATGFKLLDFSFSGHDASTSPDGLRHVRVFLNTITDATHFQVLRLSGTNLVLMAPTDGPMHFVVYY